MAPQRKRRYPDAVQAVKAPRGGSSVRQLSPERRGRKGGVGKAGCLDELRVGATPSPPDSDRAGGGQISVETARGAVRGRGGRR